MIYSVKTEYGEIRVDKDAIANIVFETIQSYDGRIMLATSKGKLLYQPITLTALVNEKAYYRALDKAREKAAGAIMINVSPNGINIKIYVLTLLGINVSHIAEDLIKAIKANTKEIFGIDLNDVTIVVSGVIQQKLPGLSKEVSG
jgi:uncharacterized alkaline shock family protein YloU